MLVGAGGQPVGIVGQERIVCCLRMGQLLEHAGPGSLHFTAMRGQTLPMLGKILRPDFALPGIPKLLGVHGGLAQHVELKHPQRLCLWLPDGAKDKVERLQIAKLERQIING